MRLPPRVYQHLFILNTKYRIPLHSAIALSDNYNVSRVLVEMAETSSTSMLTAKLPCIPSQAKFLSRYFGVVDTCSTSPPAIIAV